MKTLCSVKGCGKPGTAFLRFKIPLDDGTETTISMPVIYCEEDRYKIDKSMVDDRVWEQIEKVLPQGKKGVRDGLVIMTGEIVNSSVPPEINKTMAKFAKAATMFDRILQDTNTRGAVKAQAAIELGHCAHSASRVLRNYQGRGAEERNAAADAFDNVHELSARVSKLLHRHDEVALPGAIDELRQACGNSGNRASAALLATPGPETS